MASEPEEGENSGGGNKNIRKPRGRQLKPSNADNAQPQRKGFTVEFSIKKRGFYVVDVEAMCQRNLASGHRREVRRTGRVWFYNASTFSSDKRDAPSGLAAGVRWARYETCLQRLLEDAYRELHPWSAAEAEEAALEEAAAAADPLALVEAAAEGALTPGEARRALETLLSNEPCARSLRLLRRLLEGNQCLTCDAADVRRVALCLQSMEALQLALRAAEPGLTLAGLELFERKRAGLPLDDGGLKACLKALLARGMVLGKQAPGGKLLRKYEADAFPEWVRRYLRSMALAGMELPEHVQATVEAFCWRQ